MREHGSARTGVRVFRVRATAALSLAALLSVAMMPLTPAAAQEATPNGQARVPMARAVPAWATPDRIGAPVDQAQRVGLAVYLRWRDADAAAGLARAVSDGASGQYGQYLTPAQFRDRFAPAQASVDAVQAHLQQHGLRVTHVSDNGRYVAAEGTIAQAEAAFGTRLATYRVGGELRRAPTSPPTLPASIAGSVQAIVGLSQGARFHPLHIAADPDAPPSPAFVNAPPCSAYWAEKLATDVPPAYGQVVPWVPCGYEPAQLQGAYGVQPLLQARIDGTGQTVAITDAFAAPTILQDANQYASRHGQAQFRPDQFRQIVPPGIFDVPANDPCDPQGWYGEETLDVEAVHAMAPGANVLYVGAQSCKDTDLLAALTTIVDGNLAQIITNSWGNSGEDLPPDLIDAYTATFTQAAVEGIGVFFSSGDSGDEIARTRTRTVDFPASDPWVTAVGGTSLAVGQRDQYLFETGWGTGRSVLTNGAWSPPPPGAYQYGSGGGTSRVFEQPFYQRGVVPSDIAGYFGGNGRAVPDIAMDGDPNTGMLIGQTQTFSDGAVRYGEYRIGGTSLSSPLMAGMEALADQAAHRRHGFANPAIYGLARVPGLYRTALHDIVDPPRPVAVARNDFLNSEDASGGLRTTLRTFNQTGTLHTRPGYDDVTGVGTPRGPVYLFALGVVKND